MSASELRSSAYRHAQEGRHEEALSLLDQIIGDESTKPLTSDYFWRSACHVALVHYAEALKDCIQVTRMSPADAAGFEDRSVIHFLMGDYAEALTDLTVSIDMSGGLDSADAATLNRRGFWSHVCGQDEDAIVDFTAALEKDPSLEDAVYNRGVSHLLVGETDEALVDLSRSIELRADSEDGLSELVYVPLIQRARVLRKMKEYDKAIADLDEALSMRSDMASVYCEKGLVYFDQGQYEKAIESFSEAIRLDPSCVEGYYRRGLSRVCLDFTEEALEDFGKTLSLKPDHLPASSMRGQMSHLAGNHEQAVEDYSRVIAAQGEEPDVNTLCRHGLALCSLSRLEEASDCFVAAFAFDRHLDCLKEVLKEFDSESSDLAKVQADALPSLPENDAVRCVRMQFLERELEGFGSI